MTVFHAQRRGVIRSFPHGFGLRLAAAEPKPSGAVRLPYAR